jgi:hypothetical protein
MLYYFWTIHADADLLHASGFETTSQLTPTHQAHHEAIIHDRKMTICKIFVLVVQSIACSLLYEIDIGLFHELRTCRKTNTVRVLQALNSYLAPTAAVLFDPQNERFVGG